MKKKRKKMLKNIKREKERLEKNLDTFLKKLPDWIVNPFLNNFYKDTFLYSIGVK